MANSLPTIRLEVPAAASQPATFPFAYATSQFGSGSMSPGQQRGSAASTAGGAPGRASMDSNRSGHGLPFKRAMPSAFIDVRLGPLIGRGAYGRVRARVCAAAGAQGARRQAVVLQAQLTMLESSHRLPRPVQPCSSGQRLAPGAARNPCAFHPTPPPSRHPKLPTLPPLAQVYRGSWNGNTVAVKVLETTEALESLDEESEGLPPGECIHTLL